MSDKVFKLKSEYKPDGDQPKAILELVKGLENLPQQNLLKISVGLDELVRILGAKEIPPRLILSPEVNLPKKSKK